MHSNSATFADNTRQALLDADKLKRRDNFGLYMQSKHQEGVDGFSDYQQARQHVKAVREHTLNNLAYYLDQYERQAKDNGNHLHWARNAEEFNQTVLDICRKRDVQRVAKGKSMVTEETDLRGSLEQAGLEVTETDLGEYIIQQAGETPSHIVGPAMHKSVEEIRQLFLDKHHLGERDLSEPSAMVSEARGVLRQHFLNADLGIIGANALIAENGYSMLVTNEGNGDLSACLPKTLIVCTTIDRLLPRFEDATAALRLLARTAIGQATSTYVSFYSGPRREQDVDGPVEVHIVLLDNHRSEMLGTAYQDMLRCIRCGSCLTQCPIYNSTGGHAYGGVYTGPMGSVLTPLLEGLENAHELPNACTACGRCAEACPADIPLPDLLRNLRHEEKIRKLSPPRWRWGLAAHAWLARQPRLYQSLTSVSMKLMHMLGRRAGVFRRLPLASGWISQRDFPAPQGGTFMSRHRAMQKKNHD